MRKGITPIVGIVLALLIFLIAGAMTGSAKEKINDGVAAIRGSMGDWACGETIKDPVTFSGFMTVVRETYEKCLADGDNCGKTKCMTLDLGPSEIGDGTYNLVGFNALKNNGLDAFNGYILMLPEEPRIFCNDADHKKGENEIVAIHRNTGMINNPPWIGSGTLTASCVPWDAAGGRVAPAVVPAYFYVADGSSVKVQALKRPPFLLSGETIDLKLNIAGGTYSKYE